MINNLHEWRKHDLKRIRQLIHEYKQDNRIYSILCNCRRLEETIEMFGENDSFGAFLYRNRYKAKLNNSLTLLQRLTIIPSNMDADMKAKIEQARHADISQLFPDARNGVVRCFLHEDKKPSASISKGRFKCWVCNNKPMDAIGVLMKRDGYSFIDAVNRLA